MSRALRYGPRMSARHRPLLAACAALLVAALLAAGCGSDEETTNATDATTATTAAGSSDTSSTTAAEGGESTETILDPHIQTEQVITTFLTSPDAEKACATLSPPLLSKTYGDLAGCRQGRPPESLAKSVAIDDIEVDGEIVTATAKPTGGVYDGGKLEVTVSVNGNTALISALDANIPVGP